MKRYAVILVLLLALVLLACQSAAQPDPTNPAQPTVDAVPSDKEQPESDVTPTAPPMELDSELLQEYHAWQEHRRGENFFVFRYDGTLPERVNADIDTKDMIVGYLYVFDFALGKIVPVSDGVCTEAYDYNHSWGNVYYVPENEPFRVCVATYNRDLGEIVGVYSPYVSNGGKITALQYYGTDDNGKLLVCEDSRVIVSYDMKNQDIEVLMEAYRIAEFSYSPSSLYSTTLVENTYAEELGDVICWRGKLNAQDAESTYYYIVQKDEQWGGKEWTIKEAAPLQLTGNGVTFVHIGSDPKQYEGVDISDCELGALYYIDKTARKLYLITEEPVITYGNNDTHIFYVPRQEPSKIYAVSVADRARRMLIYESENGSITSGLFGGAFPYSNAALQFVEDDQRFIWLDLITGEAAVLMEQFYIRYAQVDSRSGTAIDENGQRYLKSTNVIYFMGKRNEADDLSQYLYYCDTGEIEEVFWQ